MKSSNIQRTILEVAIIDQQHNQQDEKKIGKDEQLQQM